ncbi:MAG TPA: amidohydrolase family protein [Alphaproteobacteria bacterium]|jgi:N-acyl-D-aspartate/D-glutamate deacylase|nr:amidohydrolase family protein [Alphaproteobacteria bacterium]
MYDRIIKGGTVVDGSGDKPFTADVALKDGCIAEVGRITATARETVDADGLIVTPGWVDIHSHYDGQVTWDSQLAPSFWHGVTTVLMGNCGVGFAPARRDKHDFLISLMEGVEDIPGTALSEGINWEWESFPEYLDALDRKSWGLDVAAQMPHGALRAYVMGDRAGRKEAATADDIAEMVRLTTEAQAAGSFGFSTSRTVFHRSSDGVPVPGTYAEADEVYAIAEALAKSGHGVLEVAPTTPDESSDAPQTELDWMADVSARTGCPITFLCLQHNQRPDWWLHQLDFCDRARDRGAVVVPQVFCRAISVMLGLRSRFHPFIRGATFKSLKDLPFAEMVRRLGEDPELRRRMALEGVANVYGADDPSDPFAGQMNLEWDKVYALGNPPVYEPTPQQSIAAIASSQGRDPREVVLDIMLEDSGESFIQYPFMGFANGDLGPVQAMLKNPHSVPGAADGGAHVSTICDGGIPTFMLTHWVRDRTAGERFPLEYIVKKQTSDTAALYGLHDRGLVKPGLKADLNLIDFAALGFDPPRMIHDLPAGGPRLMQKATGYAATLVSGEVIQRNGEDMGARPGKLVRSRRGGVV